MKQALRVRKEQKRGEPREEGPVQAQVEFDLASNDDDQPWD